MSPIKFSQKQAIIAIGIVVILIVVGVVIFLNLRPKPNSGPTISLTVWGTESTQSFFSVAGAYPFAQVRYVEVDPADYGERLIEALGSGTGPDVLQIGNRDLAKFKSILAPFPTSSSAFGPLQLSQLFPDVVAQDFVSNGQIYGLPLSIDTLAMVYNKDLFNSAGIAAPPATWNEFDDDVKKLRTVGSGGQISQAAAAIGGSLASVPHAPDLISLLMLQNGTRMVSDSLSSADFASDANGGTGPAAFNFYLQFANPASPYYTWNDAAGDAFDSFAAGKTAIMFVYQDDLETIRTKAPFLNYGIAPVPQAKGASISVNYPKYRGFVATKTGQQTAAWNFILYTTALSGAGKSFIATTGKPPALRADIQAYVNDPNLHVFAKQILTAKSWYQADPGRIDAIFDAAIRSVLTGSKDSERALKEAEAAVSQLMR